MGLKGKLLGQIEISFHGDLFHEILGDRPHHLPSMSKVMHAVEGQWGTQGCTTIFKYTQGGKTETSETVMDIIDNEKKIVKYRVVKGDLLKSYKSFIVTAEVETNGYDNFVTWTIVYEKLKEEIPEPLTFMEPHHLPSMSSVVHAVDGQWGTQGCTTIYKFTQGGKIETAETVMDTIDNEKKIVKYRVVKGDILNSYKSFIVTCEVETNGDDNFVAWTIVYEKLKEEIPEPLTYLEYFLTLTKELDDHHAKPNP
nr:kirola-like [Ipomoea batatas]